MKTKNVVEAYLNSLTNKTTRINYEIVLRDFVKLAPTLSQINEGIIFKYKESLSDKSTTTVAARLAAVRSFCDFCWTEGWLNTDPSLSVKGGVVKKYNQAKNITMKDFKKIINNIDLSTLMGVRNSLFFHMLFFCFGDIEKVLNLKLDCEMPQSILNTDWYLPLRKRYDQLLYEQVPISKIRRGFLFFNLDTLDNKKPLSLSGSRKIVRKHTMNAGYDEKFLDFQAIKRLRAKQVYEQILRKSGKAEAVEYIKRCCGFSSNKTVGEFIRQLI